MENSIIAELEEEKKLLIALIKSIVKNNEPIPTDGIPSEVGFCWVFEEFGCYYLNRIVHVLEDDTWDTVEVEINEEDEIIYYNVSVDPYIEDDGNPCYQIELETIAKFIHICKMMGWHED